MEMHVSPLALHEQNMSGFVRGAAGLVCLRTELN